MHFTQNIFERNTIWYLGMDSTLLLDHWYVPSTTSKLICFKKHIKT